MQKATQAYLQTNLSTDSPGRTVLALYDGAITFLNQAKESINAKDYARKGILISKTMAILNELTSALNREKGGAISENLRKLYFWCNTQLAAANLKMNTGPVNNVIAILSELRDAFEQIQNTPEAQAAAREISARQVSETAQTRTVSNGLIDPGGRRNTHGQNTRGRNLYGKMALGMPAFEKSSPAAQGTPD